MTWTNPITWVYKQIFTSAIFNEQIRDNLEYLKSRPLTVATIGTTNQTGITTSWVKVTNSDLQIILPVAGVLMFGWRLTFTHTVASSTLSLDIYDTNNSVYLSSGTGTPSAQGVMRVPAHATIGQSNCLSGVYIHQGVTAATHNYELRVLAGAASATLINASVKQGCWVREVA